MSMFFWIFLRLLWCLLCSSFRSAATASALTKRLVCIIMLRVFQKYKECPRWRNKRQWLGLRWLADAQPLNQELAVQVCSSLRQGIFANRVYFSPVFVFFIRVSRIASRIHTRHVFVLASGQLHCWLGTRSSDAC